MAALVFVDESGANTKMTRLRGRALGGQRLLARIPHGHYQTTTLVAGLPGYTAAILVHYAVGYENLWHLTPAFAGLALFAAGLWLSSPYLCGGDLALADEWTRRLRGVHSEG